MNVRVDYVVRVIEVFFGRWILYIIFMVREFEEEEVIDFVEY